MISLTYFFRVFDRDRDVKFVLQLLFLFFQLKQILKQKGKICLFLCCHQALPLNRQIIFWTAKFGFAFGNLNSFFFLKFW